MKYKALFALVDHGQCLWMESAQDETAKFRLQEGAGAELLDRLYRACMTEQWPNGELRRKKTAAGLFRSAWGPEEPLTRKEYADTVPLREACGIAAREKANITYRFDLDTGNFSVSSGSKLEDMDLTLPFSQDQTVVDTAVTLAKNIGFAMGTKEETWTREFKAPWKKIAKLLGEKDPMQALQRAASGDVLRNLAWIETPTQIDRNGVSYPTWNDRSVKTEIRRRFVGAIRLPGVFGPNTEATLHFVDQNDFLTLFLPFRHHNFTTKGTGGDVVAISELMVRPTCASRKCLEDLLTDIFHHDPTGSYVKRLKTLAAAIQLASRVAKASNWSEAEAVPALGWYLQDMISGYDEKETILPADRFNWTWGSLRKWCSDCIRNYSYLTGTPGPIPGQDFLLLRDGLVETGSYDWLRTTVQAALEAYLPSLRTLGWPAVLRALAPWKNAFGTIGQEVFFLEPFSSGVTIRGIVRHDGRQFLIEYMDGTLEPVMDIVERGGQFAFTKTALPVLLAETGRTKVEFAVAVLRLAFMSREDSSQADRYLTQKTDTVRKEVECLSVPTGWVYTFARFQDGAYGLAYGPHIGNEDDFRARQRLYEEAAGSPSDTALYLFP